MNTIYQTNIDPRAITEYANTIVNAKPYMSLAITKEDVDNNDFSDVDLLIASLNFREFRQKQNNAHIHGIYG